MDIIDNFGKVATTMVVLAVVLSIGFIVLSQTREQQSGLITTTNAANESLIFTATSNGTFIPLTFSGTETLELNCLQLFNDTANTQSLAGNFTCDTATGINITTTAFGLDTNLSAANHTFYVNYTYKLKDTGYNGTETTTTAVGSITDWIIIAVLVMIALLVLTFVKRMM